MMSAKRKIQQNVHLTKRVLHLEQLNTTLRHELTKERASYKELLDQVDIFNYRKKNSNQNLILTYQ